MTVELMDAVDAGDMAGIRRALAGGADPDAEFGVLDDGNEISHTVTALIVAVSSRKKMEQLRLLLDRGADVNKGNSMGVRPLMCSSNANVTRLLIQSGACVDQVDNEGMTALMYSNGEACTRVLLEAGANPNARNGRSESAIMFAKDMGQLNALLEAGADAACVADMGVTPLHIAAFMDYHRVIPFWAERYEVNVKDEQGRTPWDMADGNNAVNAKNVLFRLGAVPSLLEALCAGQEWGGLLQAIREEET